MDKRAVLRLTWSDYLFLTDSLGRGTVTKLAQWNEFWPSVGRPVSSNSILTVASDMLVTNPFLKEV